MPVVFHILTLMYSKVPWPFSRVFDRVFIMFLLVFGIYFRKTFNFSLLSTALAFPLQRSERTKLVFIGSLITSMSVALAIGGIFFRNYLSVNPRDIIEVILRMLTIIPGALSIAIIEELFFRVVLLDRLRDYLSFPRALSISALLYGLVHFISADKLFVYTGEFWWEGFLYLRAVLDRVMLPGTALGVAGLFVVGIILGLAKRRYGSVYLVIGMHAGWIFSLKMVSFLSLPNPNLSYTIGLTGRYALFAEWLSWVSFIVVLAFMYTAERLGFIKRVFEK
jgi:membrane protease YdiL (CAAX protease family)